MMPTRSSLASANRQYHSAAYRQAMVYVDPARRRLQCGPLQFELRRPAGGSGSRVEKEEQLPVQTCVELR